MSMTSDKHQLLGILARLDQLHRRLDDLEQPDGIDTADEPLTLARSRPSGVQWREVALPPTIVRPFSGTIIDRGR
jgi:hypothetical protein